ncbi:unnamed protein product [Urochloa humidicola]
MGRSPCCEKEGLKKGPWTPEEDQKLLAYIEQHGHGCWRSLPAKAGLQRCGKSCRLRWTNYLRPDIKRGKFSLQEEQTIIQLHALLGNRWSAIATHLPKRTDNEIKNYWNTHLKKRLAKMGIDPVTHKPRSDALGSGGGGAGAAAAAGAQHAKAAAHLSHTAQWESARLEAEARLAREARLRALAASVQAPPPPPHAAAPSSSYAAAHGLESPTSTLSFSESAALVSVLEAHGAAAVAAAAAARAAMQPMHGSYEVEACKEHEQQQQQQQQWGGDHVVHAAAADAAAFAGAGFTGLLLDGALNEHDLRPAGARDGGADAGAGMQQETEEERNYWDSIMNLVNSSSAMPLPAASVIAVLAPESYSSSSASFTTSVAVTLPEAYSPVPEF